MFSPLVESLRRLYSKHKITEEKVNELCSAHNFSDEEKNYILGEEKE